MVLSKLTPGRNLETITQKYWACETFDRMREGAHLGNYIAGTDPDHTQSWRSGSSGRRQRSEGTRRSGRTLRQIFSCY